MLGDMNESVKEFSFASTNYRHAWLSASLFGHANMNDIYYKSKYREYRIHVCFISSFGSNSRISTSQLTAWSLKGFGILYNTPPAQLLLLLSLIRKWWASLNTVSILWQIWDQHKKRAIWRAFLPEAEDQWDWQTQSQRLILVCVVNCRLLCWLTPKNRLWLRPCLPTWWANRKWPNYFQLSYL